MSFIDVIGSGDLFKEVQPWVFWQSIGKCIGYRSNGMSGNRPFFQQRLFGRG